MAAFTAFLDDVMPELPGAPQALVLYHVKRACSEFIRRSSLYRKTTGAITVSANPGDITLTDPDLPTGQQLLAVKGGWWYGKQLNPATLEGVEFEFGDDWQTQVGSPTHYLQQTLNTVRLVPQPDATQNAALRLSIVYGPAESSTTLPDELFERYRDPIAMGAKGRLMVMPGKPWTSQETGAAYIDAFNSAASGAKLTATRGTAGVKWQTKPVHF